MDIMLFAPLKGSSTEFQVEICLKLGEKFGHDSLLKIS